MPIFICNPDVIERLEFSPAERFNFIYENLKEIKTKLEKFGSSLAVLYGRPIDVFKNLLANYHICSVYTNRDYEPYSTYLDLYVGRFLRINKIEFLSYKDHVIFEKDELIKADGKPYTVFTAYKNRFIEKYNNELVRPLNTSSYFDNFLRTKPFRMPSCEELGFKKMDIKYPSKKLSQRLLEEYSSAKDISECTGNLYQIFLPAVRD